MPFEVVGHTRRWKVERSDGRSMECHIVVVKDMFGGLGYETRTFFDDDVFSQQLYPSRELAERDADDALKNFVERGWVKVGDTN